MNSHSTGKDIEAALAREDWQSARRLILRDLKADPDNHWLLARLSTTYYEERDYDKAWDLIERAYRLNPDCPLVRWDYAATLDAIGWPAEALKIFGSLIAKGPRELGGVAPCGEGLEWALSLLSDCIFRAGVCWEHMGKKDIALRWYQAFLKLRDEWSEGIHAREEAEKRIENISPSDSGSRSSVVACKTAAAATKKESRMSKGRIGSLHNSARGVRRFLAITESLLGEVA